MKRLLFILITVAMVVSCAEKDESLVKLDDLFSGLFPQDEPGAAVLVMKGDEIVFDKGYGIADIDTKVPIDGNTFFNIASVSKQFTATAVLQLVEKGELSLDDCVAKYHPEFESDIWKKVRIGQLLSHSSGVPDARRGYTREQKVAGDDKLAMEYMMTLDTLNFEPGTDYEYINPTFVLCGDIVSKVSGMPFTEYMRKNVFTPAGMENTLYFDPEIEHSIPNMAHGYEYEDVAGMPEEHPASRQSSDEPKNWYEYDYGEETFFATKPDGGIYTSTHEFAEWEKALRSNKVISEESRNLAQSPITDITGSTFSDYQNRENTWYGMGWFVEPKTDNSSLVIYHTGDNGGFKILAARYPESNALLLIFANRTDWDRYEVMQRAEEILGF
ncbi:MAG: beta-lactamase family protein [Bacteroidales bacterium]|nr:beta-lactamase family protein [Candidatus Cacconaster merdequi]